MAYDLLTYDIPLSHQPHQFYYFTLRIFITRQNDGADTMLTGYSRVSRDVEIDSRYASLDNGCRCPVKVTTKPVGKQMIHQRVDHSSGRFGFAKCVILDRAFKSGIMAI